MRNPFRGDQEYSRKWKEHCAPEEQRAVTFQDFWGAGATSTSQMSTMEGALRLGAVFSAVDLIAGLLSSIPLEGFTRKAHGGTSKMDPQPPLLVNPTVYGYTVNWVHRYVVSMLLRGNAYGYVISTNKYGYPTQIEWLHPDEVTIKNNYTIAAPQFYWRGREIDPNSFIHIPHFTVPGRVLGLSPINSYRMSIETGLKAGQFGVDWFSHGAVPSGVITMQQKTRDDEQVDAIKRSWRKMVEGRDIAVLGAGATWDAISVSPDESQFLDTIKASATQIASIYHIPPEMIGGDSGNSLVYANIESRRSDLAVFTLLNIAVKLETALKMALPGQQFAKFNFDEFARPDMLTRYQANHLALSDGWKTDDEVREPEGYAPLTDDQRKQLAEAFAMRRPTAAAPAAADPTAQQKPKGPDAVPISKLSKVNGSGNSASVPGH